MHAEATSEKMAMGHFCDGRASLVIGTHTHVPTADAQILPGGTAYQTDAGGCCGGLSTTARLLRDAAADAARADAAAGPDLLSPRLTPRRLAAAGARRRATL